MWVEYLWRVCFEIHRRGSIIRVGQIFRRLCFIYIPRKLYWLLFRNNTHLPFVTRKNWSFLCAESKLTSSDGWKQLRKKVLTLISNSYFQGLRKAIHFFMFRTPWPLSIWTISQLLCQHNTTTLQFTRAKCMVTTFPIGKLRCRQRFTIYEEFTLICSENLELAADYHRRE